MKPYCEDDAVAIYHGDCQEVLPTLRGIGQVLTSPPYNLNGDGNNSGGSYFTNYGWQGFKSAHASLRAAEAETVPYSGHIVDLEALAIVRQWKNGWQHP